MANFIFQNEKKRTLFRYIVGQYVTIHDDVISHINITDVKATDGGAYACLASNAVGSVQHSGRLNVYGKLFFQKLRKETLALILANFFRLPAAANRLKVDKSSAT